MPEENEKPNVNKFVVDYKLETIDSCNFYKLSLVEEEENNNKYFLLPIDNFVLAPGLILEIENKELIPYKTILKDEKIINGAFASNIFHYIDGEFKINFPEIVNTLNWDLSGIVQDSYTKNEFAEKIGHDRYLFKYSYNTTFFKVKLDNPVILNNEKIYKHIYIPYNSQYRDEKEQILNGYKLVGLKIDPFLLFESNKVAVSKEIIKFNDVISGEDKNFIKKNYLYKSLSKYMNWILIPISLLIGLAGLIQILIYSGHFGHVYALILLVFTIWLNSSAYTKIENINFDKKDDLLKIKQNAEIKSNIFFNIFIILIIFFFFIMFINYNSSYVYDSKKNELRSNYFIIDTDEILNFKKINSRYYLVNDKYVSKVFYKNKNKLLNEDNILALDVEVKFTEGLHLKTIKQSQIFAKEKLQKDIESGKFADWNKDDIINDVNFQKSLIDIREVFKSYILEDYYKNNSSEEKKNIIEYIEVKSRYTRLY